MMSSIAFAMTSVAGGVAPCVLATPASIPSAAPTIIDLTLRREILSMAHLLLCPRRRHIRHRAAAAMVPSADRPGLRDPVRAPTAKHSLRMSQWHRLKRVDALPT